MKILFVFNHPAPYKVRLFNALAKDVDLDVIFERKKASDRPDEYYFEKQYDFNCIFLKRGAFSNENSNTSELVKYLKKHHGEYDLIVMNGYSTLTEIRAIRYLKKHNIPFALYVNGGVIKKDSKLKYIIKKSLVSSATWYFSPSDEASEYLKYYGANIEKTYQYNYSTIMDKDVLDKPVSIKEKKELRNKYNLPDGTLFISASQFIERKNILFLLECFKGLDEELVLVGDGPQKDKYLQYINENKMDNVLIKEYMNREDLLEYFKVFDAFITLSKEDIYGHTINEAMSKGLPVISSSNVVAAHKLIKHKENGFIVSLDDKKSIINFINDVKSLSSERALESAKENTLEVMAKQHLEIFKRIVKEK